MTRNYQDPDWKVNCGGFEVGEELREKEKTKGKHEFKYYFSRHRRI